MMFYLEKKFLYKNKKIRAEKNIGSGTAAMETHKAQAA